MICAGTNDQFRKLCTSLGHDEWAEDERFLTNSLRKKHETILSQMISEITITKKRDEWIDLLQQYKIPCGKVHSIAEALEQPQVKARDLIGEIEHPEYGKIKFVKNPLQFSNLNIQYKLAPPLLGEHSNEHQEQKIQ